MVNNKNYKSALDNIPFSEDLDSKILSYLSSHSLPYKKNSTLVKVKNKRSYISFAAAVTAMILTVTIYMFNNNSDFKLINSVGNVSVKYVNKVPDTSLSHDLAALTEEELFHEYNTDIFMGKIEGIKNIKINFNGSIDYRAIAKIRIDKIYRGNSTVGETVSVLLPCPIKTNIWVEDTEVISSMRVGMTGIFMPLKYDKTSYREENGARIYLQDIAEYGFLDGVRYAFLNSEKGLIFDKVAYKPISSATSLQEVEAYIIKMIK